MIVLGGNRGQIVPCSWRGWCFHCQLSWGGKWYRERGHSCHSLVWNWMGPRVLRQKKAWRFLWEDWGASFPLSQYIEACGETSRDMESNMGQGPGKYSHKADESDLCIYLVSQSLVDGSGMCSTPALSSVLGICGGGSHLSWNYMEWATTSQLKDGKRQPGKWWMEEFPVHQDASVGHVNFLWECPGITHESKYEKKKLRIPQDPWGCGLGLFVLKL